MWLRYLVLALTRIKRAEAKGKQDRFWSAALCNQKARLVAGALINYIKDSVKEDKLALSWPTQFKTRALGKAETPMFDTGALLNHLHMKKVSDCVYMVYWDDRRVYEDKKWTARDIVDFHRDRRRITLSGEKKKRWAKWFWTQATKAGMSPEQVRHGQGRANTMTFKARPFFDRAVKRFIARFNGKNGISIFTHARDDKTVLIKVR